MPPFMGTRMKVKKQFKDEDEDEGKEGDSVYNIKVSGGGCKVAGALGVKILTLRYF